MVLNRKTINKTGKILDGCSISVLAAAAARSMPETNAYQSPRFEGIGTPMSRPTVIQTPVRAKVTLAARGQPGRRLRKIASTRVALKGVK